jgi:hypothetical protein
MLHADNQPSANTALTVEMVDAGSLLPSGRFQLLRPSAFDSWPIQGSAHSLPSSWQLLSDGESLFLVGAAPSGSTSSWLVAQYQWVLGQDAAAADHVFLVTSEETPPVAKFASTFFFARKGRLVLSRVSAVDLRSNELTSAATLFCWDLSVASGTNAAPLIWRKACRFPNTPLCIDGQGHKIWGYVPGGWREAPADFDQIVAWETPPQLFSGHVVESGAPRDSLSGLDISLILCAQAAARLPSESPQSTRGMHRDVLGGISAVWALHPDLLQTEDVRALFRRLVDIASSLVVSEAISDECQTGGWITEIIAVLMEEVRTDSHGYAAESLTAVLKVGACPTMSSEGFSSLSRRHNLRLILESVCCVAPTPEICDHIVAQTDDWLSPFTDGICPLALVLNASLEGLLDCLRVAVGGPGKDCSDPMPSTQKLQGWACLLVRILDRFLELYDEQSEEAKTNFCTLVFSHSIQELQAISSHVRRHALSDAATLNTLRCTVSFGVLPTLLHFSAARLFTATEQDPGLAQKVHWFVESCRQMLCECDAIVQQCTDLYAPWDDRHPTAWVMELQCIVSSTASDFLERLLLLQTNQQSEDPSDQALLSSWLASHACLNGIVPLPEPSMPHESGSPATFLQDLAGNADCTKCLRDWAWERIEPRLFSKTSFPAIMGRAKQWLIPELKRLSATILASFLHHLCFESEASSFCSHLSAEVSQDDALRTSLFTYY